MNFHKIQKKMFFKMSPQVLLKSDDRVNNFSGRTNLQTDNMII